jgi:hypothetical protein
MSAINKLQNFEALEVHRSQLKDCGYNPRKISKLNEKKLKKIIKKHGLVSPITWNKRTGNIVGGHQRIEAIDSISKTEDYSLTVAVIDVDEKTEAELNVNLNYKGAQGGFDSEMLQVLSSDFDINLTDDLFFNKVELEQDHGIYLDDSGSLDNEFSNDVEAAFTQLSENKDEALEEAKEKRDAKKAEEKQNHIDNSKKHKKEEQQQIKEQREEGTHQLSADTKDYDLQLIFANNKQKKAFLKKNGKRGDEKYVQFEEIAHLL